MSRAAMKLAALLAVVLLAAAPLAAVAAEGAKLDRLPVDVNPNDPASLQRGAQTYVNYCLGCHSLGYMRYNRLQDLGLTEPQIRDNLIFTGAKVGELMKTAMDPRESKEWFGAAPPDLSVIARSRSSHEGSGADWLYSYLRGFYRDPSRPTGWNNTIFPNVGMPHVLSQLQGEQKLEKQVRTVPRGTKGDVIKFEDQTLVVAKAGTLKPAEYDRLVADLVNFMAYVAEPARQRRTDIGIWVLAVLGIFVVLSYLIKKEYWKDIH